MSLEDIEDIYELSPTQQGILFHTLLSSGSTPYFVQMVYSLEGDFEFQTFEAAWQSVIDRHAILRTSFSWEDIDKPLQIVHRCVKVPLQYFDWTQFSVDDQKECLKGFLKQERGTGFSLSKVPLLRLTLILVTLAM